MSPFAHLVTISRLALRDDAPAPTEDDSPYGYKPSEAVAILFITLFGISTILHVAQATYYRMWWLLPTAVLCALAESLGWSARLWSSLSITAQTPFLIQISTIILAPTPLLAASFIIAARVMERLGPMYSRLTPKWYTILFLPCDSIALVVQGVGGGMASSADDLAGANVGANVMLGGIAFQFGVIIIFSGLMLDFITNYLRDHPVRTADDLAPRGALTRSLKLMLAALAFSTTTLFIRSVYRLIELSGGWDGPIIQTEVYFNVLDGCMVVLAMFTMNFAHPGLLLREPPRKDQIKMEALGSAEILLD